MLLLSTASNGINIEPQFVLILLAAAIVVLIGNLIVKAVKKDKLTKAFATLYCGDKLVLCNGMNGTFLSKFAMRKSHCAHVRCGGTPHRRAPL